VDQSVSTTVLSATVLSVDKSDMVFDRINYKYIYATTTKSTDELHHLTFLTTFLYYWHNDIYRISYGYLVRWKKEGSRNRSNMG
jgi:hypothetical protein